MKRRQFLQNLAWTAAAAQTSSAAPSPPDTLVCEFTHQGVSWKVYEDFADREGGITFTAAAVRKRALKKSAEAAFAEADPPYLGPNFTSGAACRGMWRAERRTLKS